MNQLSLTDIELNQSIGKYCYIEPKFNILNFFRKDIKKAVSTKIISEFDNCITFKMHSTQNKYNNYVKNLLERNDLTAFFRSHSKSHMLRSRTTQKKYCEERIIAYAKPILELARSLFSGGIYFDKNKGLKVNFYSLNPHDLSKTIQDKINFDNIKETLHLDIEPKNIAFNGNSFLILTFCIIRGVNQYDKTMGKQLYFPKIDEKVDYCVIPQIDSDPDLEITIFLSDVVEHGSTSWNMSNKIVKENFDKVILGDNINYESSPGRMSITMPIFFKTNEPKKLWNDIKKKLKGIY
jgi:hypothetical protein